MFDHMGIVVNDSEKSIKFYENCLAAVGLKIIERQPELGAVIFAGKKEFPFLWIGSARGGFWAKQHKAGKSPVHLAFIAPSRKAVDAFYRAGLENGGRDNGKPEDCGNNYYAAYLLDPDGNNIEAGFHK